MIWGPTKQAIHGTATPGPLINATAEAHLIDLYYCETRITCHAGVVVMNASLLPHWPRALPAARARDAPGESVASE